MLNSLLFFSMFVAIEPAIGQDNVELSIDSKCNVTFKYFGEKSDLESQQIVETISNRLVIEKFQIDHDLVKAQLPNIDFSKALLSMEEAQEVERVVDELGPWRFTRYILASPNNKVECLFNEKKVLLAVEKGQIPYDAKVLYTVESN